MQGGSARRWLAVAATIATGATAGSLWLSLAAELDPCRLCWYQRVALFPLVPVLWIAVAERRATAYRTTLPLSVAGLGIAVYHSVLQATVTTCGTGGCAAVQWRAPVVGATIPNCSAVVFAAITATALAARHATRT